MHNPKVFTTSQGRATKTPLKHIILPNQEFFFYDQKYIAQSDLKQKIKSFISKASREQQLNTPKAQTQDHIQSPFRISYKQYIENSIEKDTSQDFLTKYQFKKQSQTSPFRIYNPGSQKRKQLLMFAQGNQMQIQIQRQSPTPSQRSRMSKGTVSPLQQNFVYDQPKRYGLKSPGQIYSKPLFYPQVRPKNQEAHKITRKSSIVRPTWAVEPAQREFMKPKHFHTKSNTTKHINSQFQNQLKDLRFDISESGKLAGYHDHEGDTLSCGDLHDYVRSQRQILQ